MFPTPVSWESITFLSGSGGLGALGSEPGFISGTLFTRRGRGGGGGGIGECRRTLPSGCVPRVFSPVESSAGLGGTSGRGDLWGLP